MKIEVVDINKATCTLCSDTIESKRGHDFITCKCGALSVDGGRNYLRRSFKDPLFVIEESKTHFTEREFEWEKKDKVI